MSNPLTITEFARLGGKARAKRLSKAERSESAKKAADARWRKVEELGESVRKKSDDLVKLNRKPKKAGKR